MTEMGGASADGGEWVAAACWHNCGGRCANKVLVKDGVVVRQKTDDTHQDSFAYPQQRGCVRGRAQQQQCFGEDRILHPLKRAGWQPGGGAASNGQMRGKDTWEVISWDEAICLACSEIKRISEEYGPTGFYCKKPDASIKLMCGCVRGWDTTSYGAYALDATLIGLPLFDLDEGNDRFDMQNADYVVMWSSNPAWSASGTTFTTWINARDHGTKFISVDPLYNASAQTLDAVWIPVRPGTDMALMLACAFEMLRLDAEEGAVVDWDFLNRCTVGFDSAHMPKDARLNENLQDYLLGAYDGQPKTPAWAARICGCAEEQVTWLARVLSKRNKVMLTHNYGLARNNGAEMIPQMFMALGAMGGHMGTSGNATCSVYHANAGNSGPALVRAGQAKATVKVENKTTIQARQPQLYEVIAKGGGTVSDVGNCYERMHAAVPTTLGPVKCIFHVNDAALQTSTGQKLGIAAHRAVDFVLTRAQFMTTNARYSDIILPVTTEWERVGDLETYTNRETVRCYSQVTPPLGEAKTDQEIGTLLLQGMGIDPALAYPASEEQAYMEKIASCTVFDQASGEMVPLVTITQADIDAWGVDLRPQMGIVSLAEFRENGGYQFPRHEGDGLGYVGYQKFVDDPEGHPLESASGKLEIYCQARYDLMMSFGFPHCEHYKPYPTYFAPFRGYEATFANGVIGGEAGEYPFLLYNIHYLRRSHTVFDNCPWLREAWANPLFLNADDAEKLGLKEGDTALVTTPGGQCIRRVAPMDILMPGVVALPHGAWVDVDEDTGIDHAGSDNYLIDGEYGGMGLSGYNNQVCKVEKYAGDALGPDCQLPPRWSEARDSGQPGQGSTDREPSARSIAAQAQSRGK